MSKKRKTAKQLAQQIKQVQKEIAKKRDELRDLLNDAYDIEQAAGDAVELLDQAVDRLSEYL